MPREVEIIILSDTHLGSYNCHADELLRYLQRVHPQVLVLNGDFLDIEYFRKNRLPHQHRIVIERILEMSKQGTKVFYLNGNHDFDSQKIRELMGNSVDIRSELNFLINKKQYWILHGDLFETWFQYSSIFRSIGRNSYKHLVWFNRLVNRQRARFSKLPVSLATKVKNQVREAVLFFNQFESLVVQEAAKRNVDLVICGHIHQPKMQQHQIGNKQVVYLNAGDWVENLTALELNRGIWSVFRYNKLDFVQVNPKLQVLPSAKVSG